jgi:hypothetical protein
MVLDANHGFENTIPNEIRLGPGYYQSGVSKSNLAWPSTC